MRDHPPRVATPTTGHRPGSMVQRLRKSAAAALSSRRRWIAIVLVLHAIILAAGWFVTVEYVRRAAETAIAVRLSEGGGGGGVAAVGGPASLTWREAATSGFIAVSITIGLLMLALTGLFTARLMQRHDVDMDAINAGLELEVRKRVNQALGFRNAMITGLAKLADYRDTDTGAHLDRIAEYSALLAGALQSSSLRNTTTKPHPFQEVDDAWIARLRIASALHDIGKVGVPDAVLLKPGRLTPEERTEIERHPIIGSDTLVAVRDKMGQDELVEMSIRIALFHHEKWDGSGYPMHLTGDQIPLEARVVALADVYDALTSRRVYKEALTHDAALAKIRDGAGNHFDAAVVDAFLAVAKEFDAVRERLQGK